MHSLRGAVLVVDTPAAGIDGILTPKDLLFRVVAGRLPAATTPVAAVMTPKPDVMLASSTPALSCSRAPRRRSASSRHGGGSFATSIRSGLPSAFPRCQNAGVAILRAEELMREP